ncbi:hypothetical protein GGTG_14241 [Gaeumannomyces tritici R3-111a-1]|uniref:Uncharacterized protein n=1 Tax=Gaeumannomyces tritici (strain R3-111a-1) TaxID=644352 RepID=J3PL08_GAET3|nr:hypothetical protein GGTG_14241 [Gaeumannomyces tritici R3-111a-1]EJT68180.1 hypothetical protein GGTG_14241 [Gaeumannomyces tritici R3-111a-1]
MPRWQKAAPVASYGPHLRLRDLFRRGAWPQQQGARERESLPSVCKALSCARVRCHYDLGPAREAQGVCSVDRLPTSRPASMADGEGARGMEKNRKPAFGWAVHARVSQGWKGQRHTGRGSRIALSGFVGVPPCSVAGALGLTLTGSQGYTEPVGASARQAASPPAPFSLYRHAPWPWPG